MNGFSTIGTEAPGGGGEEEKWYERLIRRRYDPLGNEFDNPWPRTTTRRNITIGLGSLLLCSVAVLVQKTDYYLRNKAKTAVEKKFQQHVNQYLSDLDVDDRIKCRKMLVQIYAESLNQRLEEKKTAGTINLNGGYVFPYDTIQYRYIDLNQINGFLKSVQADQNIARGLINTLVNSVQENDIGAAPYSNTHVSRDYSNTERSSVRLTYYHQR